MAVCTEELLNLKLATSDSTSHLFVCHSGDTLGLLNNLFTNRRTICAKSFADE